MSASSSPTPPNDGSSSPPRTVEVPSPQQSHERAPLLPTTTTATSNTNTLTPHNTMTTAQQQQMAAYAMAAAQYHAAYQYQQQQAAAAYQQQYGMPPYGYGSTAMPPPSTMMSSMPHGTHPSMPLQQSMPARPPRSGAMVTPPPPQQHKQPQQQQPLFSQEAFWAEQEQQAQLSAANHRRMYSAEIVPEVPPRHSRAIPSTSEPHVYNAPAAAAGSATSKVKPVLIRTNSGPEDQQQQQQATIVPIKQESKKPPKTTRHKRSSSETPLLPPRRSPVPPSGAKSTASSTASSVEPMRRRSYSAGLPTPTHRRTDSLSNLSVASQSSVASIVSNIAKSTFFGGVDPTTGAVQLHYPMEKIRLVMTNPQVAPRTIGKLYQEVSDQDLEDFEAYHEDDEENPLLPSDPDAKCLCTCAACNGCSEKSKATALPQAKYVLPVQDDVYRRVLTEIGDAHWMPCGLFFCGHHEDVSFPSIWIAVVIVTILMISLLILSIMTAG